MDFSKPIEVSVFSDGELRNVAQMDDLGAHALQDASHDVDGCVVAIKQAGGGDKANLVLGTVAGQSLEFSVQVGHGFDGVNRKKLRNVKGYWRVACEFKLT
jgi:predicted HAD superfamily phosphohydrolase